MLRLPLRIRSTCRKAPSTLRVALVLVALAAISVMTAGCKAKEGGRAKVAVSVFPIYDLTRRIAGPDADVVLVVKPPATAGSFTPSAADEGAIAGAKLGVMVGLGLDVFLENLVKGGQAKARILKVGDRVPTVAGPTGAVDPTFWLDPQRARIATKAIGEELARIDVGHAIVFRARAAELDAALEKLDAEIDAKARAWKQHRVSVEPAGAGADTHESLAYFADRYGIELVQAGAPNGKGDPAPAKLSLTSADLSGSATTASYEELVRGCASKVEGLLAK